MGSGNKQVGAILEAFTAALRKVLEEIEKQLTEKCADGAFELEESLTVAGIELGDSRYIVTGVAGTSYKKLSPRQREVATLLADGLSRKDIAQRLQMSVRTVDSHRERLYAELQVASRGALMRRVVLMSSC